MSFISNGKSILWGNPWMTSQQTPSKRPSVRACSHIISGSRKTSNTFYSAFRSQVWKVLLLRKRKKQRCEFPSSTLNWLTLLRIPFWQGDFIKEPSKELRGFSGSGLWWWVAQTGRVTDLSLNFFRSHSESPLNQLYSPGPQGAFPCWKASYAGSLLCVVKAPQLQ